MLKTAPDQSRLKQTTGDALMSDDADDATASESALLAVTIASALGDFRLQSGALLVSTAREGILQRKLKKSELDDLADQLIQTELSTGSEN